MGVSETLKINRIKTRIDAILSEKIDSTDMPGGGDDLARKRHVYSRAIAALAIMIRAGLDSDDAASCVTDGFKDLGIDAIYNDEDQRKLIIVQSKWRTSGTGGITQDEMLQFVQGISRIVSFDLDDCNDKLATKRLEIDSVLNDINYQIEIVFCHTGNQKCTAQVKKPLDDLMRQLNSGTPDVMVFKEIVLEEIYEFLASGQGDTDIVLEDVALNNWGFIEEPYKAYYGVVSADVIGGWYQQYGNKLFNKNIRFYKGSTEVNHGMQDVLCTEPENFFYYNNGIKLLCRKIIKKPLRGCDNRIGIFHLEGVSLVNGAQTTGSIGSVFATSSSSVAKAKVLIQMVELGTNKQKEATQITRLTNTQNRIEGKDFAALDPQQERIRKDLQFYGIEYFYKTGASVNDGARQISLEEAIVAQACSLMDPTYVHIAKQNVGALTENIERKPYKLLFNAKTSSCELVNNVRLLRLVEEYVARRQKDVESQKRIILVQGNRALLHLVIRSIKMDQAEYKTALIDHEALKSRVDELCSQHLTGMVKFIEQRWPDLHLFSVFKNSARTREIVNFLAGNKIDAESNSDVLLNKEPEAVQGMFNWDGAGALT